MNKMIISILSILLICGLIGCDSIIDAESIISDNIGKETDTEKLYPNEKDTNSELIENTTENQDPDYSNSNQGNSAEIIEYIFYSVKDMHTYLTTGSRNPEDYSKAPVMPLDEMPSKEDYKTRAYKDLEQLFSFNEEAFDSVEASFANTDKGGIIYRYYMDNVYITVQRAYSDDIVESFANLMTGKTVSEMNVKAYSVSNSRSNGYELRMQSDFEVLYCYENGIRKAACCLIDGCLITINGVALDCTAEAYEEFTTSKKTVPFAAFFSDDDTTFESAIKALKENVEKSK